MKISLAEIFVQTPNKTTYSKEELWVLVKHQDDCQAWNVATIHLLVQRCNSWNHLKQMDFNIL